MTQKKPHLMIFGPGYTALAFAKHVLAQDWTVTATARGQEKSDYLKACGITPIPFGQADTLAGDTTHILSSIAPNPQENNPSFDAVLNHYQNAIMALPKLQWVGYMSSTNVYGDHGGSWVTEESRLQPSLPRGIRRVKAEKQWQNICENISHIPVFHTFRLAGIYGPNRNAITSLKTGKARIIKNNTDRSTEHTKPEQVFSRIHVDDIVQAIYLAAKQQPKNGAFNLADDHPCPPQDVIHYAAKILGIKPPTPIDINDASISDMARSFYKEHKRINCDKAKTILGWQPAYPDFKIALDEILLSEG